MVGNQNRLDVKWTKTAEKQFFRILDYWIERNKTIEYADKLTVIVWERIEFIANNPLASVLTSYPNTRRASLGHYSLFYKVSKTKVIITSFWDNRQDPKKLYKNLMEDDS